jgi:hypothetical protein
MVPIDPIAYMPLANLVIRCEGDKPRREPTDVEYAAAHWENDHALILAFHLGLQHACQL